jgi:hypothetical protein
VPAGALELHCEFGHRTSDATQSGQPAGALPAPLRGPV